MSSNGIRTELWAHSAQGSIAVDEIDVEIERLSSTNLHIRYHAIGTISDVTVQSPAPPLRSDNLWRTTCFELFLRGGSSSAYREFNFSPSGRWAAYEFSAYRADMTQAQLPAEPVISAVCGADRLIVDVRLSLDLPDEPYAMSLAAVIEERRTGISYWAVSHAAEKPDFHHPACFVLELPPPSGA